jgi:signal transduction histidine kinase
VTTLAVDVPRSPGRWAVAVAVAAATAAGLAAAVGTFAVPGDRDATPVDMLWLASWLSFAVVGALVLRNQPRHRAALAFLAAGALVPVAGLVDVLAFWAAHRAGTGAPAVAWLRLTQDVMFTAGTALLLYSVLLLPDGALARPWMRWPARGALVGVGAMTLGSVLDAGPIGEDLPVANPLGWESGQPVTDLLDGGGLLLLAVGTLVGLLSLVLRTRHASGVTRSQLQWLGFGVLVAVVVNVTAALSGPLGIDLPDDVGAVVSALTVPVVPVCVAVASLRHNLYDIDLLLRRSLLYTVLSGCVLVAYLLLAAAVGSTTTDVGASALLGGLIALAVLPLRTRGQRLLDRRFYGESGDPYVVLSGLGRQLSGAVAPEEVPGLVSGSVCRAMRVPWVAVELGDAEAPVLAAASGAHPGWEVVTIPLAVGGAEVGRLVVAPRGPREGLEERDLRLLEDLAGQVAVAVDGLRMSRELQRSREELVLAREEERRRLRNDLHDGLGPVLAGVLLQVGVVRERTDDPILAAAEQRLSGAVEDLRRLVYGLRPPALDELGLGGALREQLAAAGLGVDLSLSIDEDLPALPAALEVAAFRVASEAVTNVVRHSGARHCDVALTASGGELVLEVRDDGTGLTGTGRDGVGLSSMRERCAELGGTLDVEGARPHGTVVRATLPLAGLHA